tara:strand:+ start:1525 stop:1836 length:312 start_codon:yes stop_codon:yes gene_type:complete
MRGFIVLNVFLAGLFLKIAYNSKVIDIDEEERLVYLFSTLLTASISSSRIEIFLARIIVPEFSVINLSFLTIIVLLFFANSIINKNNGPDYNVKKLKIIVVKL